MNDAEVLNRVTQMCEESCSPDQMDAWDALRKHLVSTRATLAALNCLNCGKVVPINDMYTVDACSENCQNHILEDVRVE